MKRVIKYFFITLLSIIALLGVAVALALTVFRDELISLVSKTTTAEIKTYYISDLPVEPKQFAEDFESIHQQVVKECSLYKQKGYDIDSLYATFAARIPHNVHTKADYGQLLREYFAALNIGHAGVLLNVHAAEYHPTIAEDRVFITDPSEHLSANGFRDKDEIIAINGTPIKEYIEEQKKYTSASTEDYRLRRTQLALFTSATDSTLTYSVKRGGDTLSLRLPLTASLEGDEPQAYSMVLNDSVGYIGIESMMNDVIEDFRSAYNQVSHLPYLIIDIRRNGGGNSNNGRLIAEYLITREQEHCVGGDNITPQPNAYQGKLFLLTSNYTFSAAESFAIDLKESGLATLVGEKTAGDTGCAPKNFTSKYGICFRIPTREPHFSTKGFPMEGVSIEPHYEVRQSVTDLFEDKDTAIEYVLNELI